MKRILYVFAAAALLAFGACTRWTNTVGGHEYSLNSGGQYMMYIADDLIAGALENLELACEMGRTEINWVSRFSGMKIDQTAEDVWSLSYDDHFYFGDQSFPTAFTMTATRLNNKKHADWEVTITGTRTEKEGYRCSFESLGAITYQAQETTNGWNMLYGRLSMIVYNKDGKKDGCLLHFDGPPSEGRFVRGL